MDMSGQLDASAALPPAESYCLQTKINTKQKEYSIMYLETTNVICSATTMHDSITGSYSGMTRNGKTVMHAVET
jgi:hypothetical protein